ncbi:MAG TPA: peptidoglycan editing factor PgeF [Deltaproteobacteria bacterium]|nr:peptidoglycan editing factor PgeF [Deltaproteobacteria bacterium]
MRGVYCTREISEGLSISPETVRARLRELLPGSRIYVLDQVHSDGIVLAQELAPDDIPSADGIISRDSDVVLCIRTADCVPVLLWVDDMPIIGAVHAGWRGLAKGIVKKGIEYMHSFGATKIHAGIGPCIGPCCYEVGRNVVDAIGTEEVIHAGHSMYLDLAGAALSQCLEAGLMNHMVHNVNVCTSCHPGQFFSYRRDGDAAGRNLSLIGGKSWSLPGLQAE